MKTKIFILIVFLLGLSSYNVYSQESMGIGNSVKNIYEVNTVETISGEVTNIDKVFSDKNMSYGVQMNLYSSNGQILVNLGPSWFVENQNINIASGDYVNVTGSRININGDQVIIAKEVMKEDKVLMLRDDNGYPFWAVWPNR